MAPARHRLGARTRKSEGRRHRRTRSSFRRPEHGRFTSGTTGEPKGVVLTHGNILANIAPVEREVEAYRRYLWLFRPIRFLSLLPLSHMFGQALALFFPPLVNAATVFMTGYNPDEIIAQVRRRRITLVVTVPRVLDLLRDRVRQLAPRCATPDLLLPAVPRRLWRYRDVHRLFGWRFCGFVLGGAPLDQALEDFWRQTIRYIGELADDGYSILIFPEGHRTEHGEVHAFQAGVGILGSKLRLPVVPLRLEGVDRVLHRTWRWPRRGDVSVTFGAPLALEGDDYGALARRVQEAVVALGRPRDEASLRAPNAAA